MQYAFKTTMTKKCINDYNGEYDIIFLKFLAFYTLI